MSAPGSGLRLDKWLWFARFARSRNLAARLCSEGHVTVGGVPALQPSRRLKIGDELTVRQGRVLRRVRVLALGVRRGPAGEARLLYEEDAAPDPIVPAEWIPLIEDEG